MLDSLSWVLAETFESTDSTFNWIKDQRPKHFEKNVIGTNRKINLESYGYTSAKQEATLKYARFWNEKIDIATVMIYPTQNHDLIPVFAAEWVIVGDKFHVIVQDIEYLGRQDHITTFPNFPSKWKKEFENHKEIPEWFDEIASPLAIFSNAKRNEMDTVHAMFQDYLNFTLKHCYSPVQKLLQSGGDSQAVIDYKKHHNINSPARQFFSSNDSVWLNQFLDDYHFGIYENIT